MKKYLLNLCMTALLGVVCTTAWALDKVDGVYQIGTGEDLKAFAELVNGGEVYANAVLTADIDYGTENTMIGAASDKPYQGTFDGQGHAITINMSTTVDRVALFRYTGFRALIQNLKVQGTITTNNKFAGGIVAQNDGIIRGCYADVTIDSQITGDATHGGIAALGYGGTTIENCLAKISIVGEATQNCGGVVGWAEKRTNIVNCLVVSNGCTFDTSNGASYNIARNGGNLAAVDVETYNTNPYANRPKGACYNNYVTQQWGDNVATTVVPLADLADGKVCYQLNNDQSKINWVQNIGTDPFPVPAAFGSGQVYASDATGCNGLGEGLTYSNTPSNAVTTAHTFDKYGICSTCGCFDFHMFEFDDSEKFDKTDMSVLLRTKEDIDKVEGWNRIAQGFRLNMKMMNDIEYIAEEGKYIFNPSDWIDGNFNGQGHTLTIGMTNPGEKAALFPEMDGNIENLILHGTIQTANTRAGSLCGNARNALIRNVYSDVDITSTVVGDNTAGGFFGWMGDKEKHIENCIYAGTFTLPGSEAGARCARVGGFSGWTATKTYFTNCAILGNIIGAGNQTLDNDTENSQNIARNPGNVVTENVYVVNPIEGNSVSDHDKYIHYTNVEGIASGELAFLLNGNQNGLDRFYQVIGTDPEPMPIAKEGGLVYCVAAQYRCDGVPLGDDITYSNAEAGANIPPHTNVDGWCNVCGTLQEDYLTPVDGWYEISNGKELSWFSHYVGKYPIVKARLTADINMDGQSRFIPIGSQVAYTGEFDGQGHVFKNFMYTGGDYSGLFGLIANGAIIKNFVLDNSCAITGNAFVGIIGGTSGGGDIYLTNLGNEGTVTSSAQNAAGILGVDQGGAMTLHIKNCYVTGAINGARESGAMCGYSSTASEIINCWSTAPIPQSAIYSNDSFSRGGASVINCYEADIDGVDPSKQQHINPADERRRVNPITPEEVENGTLCAKLETTAFRQNADDTHPVFDQTHAVVKRITEAGYATMYIEPAVAIPNNVAVFTGEFEGTWLKLNAVEGNVPAWEPVVLKGNPGNYRFTPAAAVEKSVSIVFADLGLANAYDLTTATLTVDNIDLTFAKNDGNNPPAFYTLAPGTARIYKGNTMSIYAGGATITKIVFNNTNATVPTFDSGSYNSSTTTWEGEATTVTLTNTSSSQVRITSMVVYYSAASAAGDNIEGNVLKGADEDIQAAGKYVLAKPEGKDVGFYLADRDIIKAGKVYLESESGVKAFYFTGDDATGIDTIENEQQTIGNGAIYNLAGQRVSKMQKGINIVNGKKVLY